MEHDARSVGEERHVRRVDVHRRCTGHCFGTCARLREGEEAEGVCLRVESKERAGVCVCKCVFVCVVSLPTHALTCIALLCCLDRTHRLRPAPRLHCSTAFSGHDVPQRARAHGSPGPLLQQLPLSARHATNAVDVRPLRASCLQDHATTATSHEFVCRKVLLQQQYHPCQC